MHILKEKLVMECRRFGKIDMQLGVVELEYCLLIIKVFVAISHLKKEAKTTWGWLNLGTNLFVLGYIHILEELKGRNTNYHFLLRIGVSKPDYLEDWVDKQLPFAEIRLTFLRCIIISIRITGNLTNQILYLKQAGKVRLICMILHTLANQEAYAKYSPESDYDEDLVSENYCLSKAVNRTRKVCRNGTRRFNDKSIEQIMDKLAWKNKNGLVENYPSRDY